MYHIGTYDKAKVFIWDTQDVGRDTDDGALFFLCKFPMDSDFVIVKLNLVNKRFDDLTNFIKVG